MAEFVYILCTLTSVICAVLLFRGHRTRRTPLLFWSSLCFIGLALNNVVLLIDLYVMPQTDLFLLRAGTALAALALLLFGLIWDSH